MGKTTKYTERRFLGKTEGFKNKAEERFEQKHLAAYLKGHERFRYGFSRNKNSMGRGDVIWHDVKQEINIDEEKRKLLTGKK